MKSATDNHNESKGANGDNAMLKAKNELIKIVNNAFRCVYTHAIRDVDANTGQPNLNCIYGSKNNRRCLVFSFRFSFSLMFYNVVAPSLFQIFSDIIGRVER